MTQGYLYVTNQVQVCMVRAPGAKRRLGSPANLQGSLTFPLQRQPPGPLSSPEEQSVPGRCRTAAGFVDRPIPGRERVQGGLSGTKGKAGSQIVWTTTLPTTCSPMLSLCLGCNQATEHHPSWSHTPVAGRSPHPPHTLCYPRRTCA